MLLQARKAPNIRQEVEDSELSDCKEAKVFKVIMQDRACTCGMGACVSSNINWCGAVERVGNGKIGFAGVQLKVWHGEALARYDLVV